MGHGLYYSNRIINHHNPHNHMTHLYVFLDRGAFSKKELVSWALKQTGFTPAEKLVLIGLIWHCNSEGSCAFSNTRLKEELGLSVVTISRAISTLSLNGLVKNTRRFNNSSIRKLLIDKLILDKY